MLDGVQLSEAERAAEFIEQLSDDELAALRYDWRFWARPEQLQPEGNWSEWWLLAGRGFGKTRSGAEAVREEVMSGKAGRVALIGATANDVRETMLFGESGLMNVFPPDQAPQFVSWRNIVRFHNGAVAYLYSAEKPDRLRGPQHHFGWCDELAAWQHLEDTWSNFQMGLRLGVNPRVIVTTTPRPLEIIKARAKMVANGDTNIRFTTGSTYRNRGNLPEKFFSEIITPYEGTRLGEQELEGKILLEWEGALFKAEWFKYAPPLDYYDRIAISVDPAVGEKNDETGIVVVGRKGKYGYVLEDLSGKHSPNEWAIRALACYKKYSSKAPSGMVRIVAETNRGGKLVISNIRQTATMQKMYDVPVREVYAQRGNGKDTRAEPVAALYEQGRVFHCEKFEKLENQMKSWDPLKEDEITAKIKKKQKSPDRMDALVWGFADMGFHSVGAAPKWSKLNAELPRSEF